MANRILLLLCLLFATLYSFGQEITREKVDSMINALGKTKGIDHIELLLDLAQFHIFKPGENQIDFDSATNLINEARNLNKSFKSPAANGYQSLTESYLLKEKGKTEEARKMAEKAVDQLTAASNKNYLGRALYELSSYYKYYVRAERMQRIALVEKAIQAFQQAGTLNDNGYALEMLGDLYIRSKEYPKAIGILNRALAAFDTSHHEKKQGVYVLLGEAHSELQDEVKALSYFLQALKTANQVGDTSIQLCQINNLLGVTYLRIDMKDISLKYLEDALKVAIKYKDEYSIFLLAINMSATYSGLGQNTRALEVLNSIPVSFQNSDDPRDKAWLGIAYFRAYNGLRQFEKTLPIRDTLLKLISGKRMSEGYIYHSYRQIATYYFETGQYEKARNYLIKNLPFEAEKGTAINLIEDLRLWYKLDSAVGNTGAAFKHLLAYKNIQDSMVSANRSKQLQVLGVEYEVGMKEDSIRLRDKDIQLLTHLNNFQRANLKQERIFKNVTIAGIILALIILGLLYRQYQRKQRNNQIISHKNDQLQHLLREKEWLVKEIHHRVKNNFQTVMGLLGTQSAYLKNEEAINAMNESQHRILAMSLIHQRLYQSNNLSAINMNDYIRELVDSLNDSFNSGNRVKFNLEIEPIDLDLAHCIPLGLILNEAITNSYKYAFLEEQDGIISISLKNISGNNFLLSIKDNGRGLPAQYNMAQSNSMGMNLIRGLSSEIGAKFMIFNENGVRIEINFTYDPENVMELTKGESKLSI